MIYKRYDIANTIDLNPVSVILGADPNQPDGIKMMHCMRCGYKLGQYLGRILVIYPGLVPVLKFPFFRRCPQCKEDYAIGSISQ